MASELEVGKVKVSSSDGGYLADINNTNSTGEGLKVTTAASGAQQILQLNNASGMVAEVLASGNVKIGSGSLAAVGGGPTLGLVGAAPEITLRDSATGTPYAVMRTNDNGNLILEADSGDDAASSQIEFKVDGATTSTITGSTATFNGGIKSEKGIYGGQISIADDAVGSITPPRQGVMMAISYGNSGAYPSHGNTVGIIWCDTGSSLTCGKLTSEGSNISVFNGVDLSAAGETSSVDSNINISTISNTIQIKNRLGAGTAFWYNFIA